MNQISKENKKKTKSILLGAKKKKTVRNGSLLTYSSILCTSQYYLDDLND